MNEGESVAKSGFFFLNPPTDDPFVVQRLVIQQLQTSQGCEADPHCNHA